VLDKVPEDVRVSIHAWNNHSWKPAADLFEDFGLKVIRNFYTMAIDMEEVPPAPVWPEGITVRTYNHPEDAEAVYRAYEDAFQDHYGHIEVNFKEGFERFQQLRFNDEGFDPDLWYLAMDGDEIVGTSLCRIYSGEDKNDGQVSTLGVRRPWRRKGIALALLHHSFGELWERGKKHVNLGVDAESLTGAVDLYEKAGMHIHHQTDLYELELRPGRELSKMELDG
jgi:mycothiol synthase